MRILPALLICVLPLGGCGDGPGSVAATASAVTVAPALTGRVADAPPGTVVHLVAPEAAEGDGLLGQAAAIVATVDVVDGAFALDLEAGLPRPSEAIVSAPGRAIVRAPLGALVVGGPEAVVTLHTGEVDAVAIALGQDGLPLPIPPETLASDAEGALSATRLPAGEVTLLVGSADGARHAVVRALAVAGEVTHVEVRLADDALAERRFLEAALGREGAAALVEGRSNDAQELP